MNVANLNSDTDFLCGSTSATYSPTDKLRNYNIHYHDVVRLIWESATGWVYNDGTATGNPTVNSSLTHNVQDYTIPTTAQRIRGIDVKDIGGALHKLRPLDLQGISLAPGEYQKTPGLPVEYALAGRTVSLYPTPSSAYTTMASGIVYHVDKEITELTGVGSTPGFATPFHRILSHGASLDFTQDDQQRKFLASQKARLEQGLIRFYSKRAVEMPTTIKPKGKRFWRQYT